ncbi:hypothetical protein [Microbulbifer epialgicus]|uniref:Uncharacterized protein n=1 Tax=Microbulbifer epialgicus TaxID=393907 RepID=A0ABV4P5C8_9GAMM
MSGRKNKHKQRGQQRKQPSELLDELNSLHDLLNNDDLDEIPLLNQVAKPSGQRTQQPSILEEVPTLSAEPIVDSLPEAPAAPQPLPVTEKKEKPLDEADLPILFSPLEDQTPQENQVQLAESDLALLRPLQELPTKEMTSTAPLSPTENANLEAGAEPARQTPPIEEPVQENSVPVADNPFLPAHIRARLTGGKIPPGENQEAPKPEPINTNRTGTRTQALVMAQAMAEREGPADKLEPSEKERQRQALIEQLVAQQLPELERQLRTQIEKVVDELGVWD